MLSRLLQQCRINHRNPCQIFILKNKWDFKALAVANIISIPWNIEHKCNILSIFEALHHLSSTSAFAVWKRAARKFFKWFYMLIDIKCPWSVTAKLFDVESKGTSSEKCISCLVSHCFDMMLCPVGAWRSHWHRYGANLTTAH